VGFEPTTLVVIGTECIGSCKSNYHIQSQPQRYLENSIKANLAGMVLGWSPFNIVSDSPALHSKWLLLQKIEISLVVNFHFITNQNELKF
jgi:hypothetical protein